MTKNTIEIIEKLKSDESLHSSDIYALYDKAINVNDYKEMFSLLEEWNDLPYDFMFQVESSQLLGVKRSEICEFALGLCSLVGEKLEKEAQGVFIVARPNNVKAYCSINDREYVVNRLLRTDYAKYILGEEFKVKKTDWYKLYEWDLYEY